MATNEDDILLGSQVLTSKESVDSDGDGVSDTQERFEGTDPDDAADHIEVNDLAGRDLQSSLDPADLERMTVFDPTANLLAGTSIDTDLAGLTNLDGSDLRAGPNHHGVGDDAILAGRLDVNSPLSMQSDPTQGLSTTSSLTSGSGSSTPPSDADLGFNAPNDGLVSNDSELSPLSTSTSVTTTTTTDDEGWTKQTENVTNTKTGEGVTTVTVRDPAGTVTAYNTTTNSGETVKMWRKPETKTYDDPNADVVEAPTEEAIDRAIAVAGGDSTPVRDEIVAPEIEATGTPPTKGDPLVTDPIDGEADLGGDQPLPYAPGSDLTRPVNTDGVFVSPTLSGDGGAPNTGLAGDFDAATAATATTGESPEISLIGSGESGIATLAVGTDEVLGTAAVPPGTVLAEADVVARQAGDAATAVDSFAAEYLEDASRAESGVDVVSTGLASDLGADLAPLEGDFEVNRDLIDEPIEELSVLDRGDDNFDGG